MINNFNNGNPNHDNYNKGQFAQEQKVNTNASGNINHESSKGQFANTPTNNGKLGGSFNNKIMNKMGITNQDISEDINKQIGGRAILTKNGPYHVEHKDGKLRAGTATNTGLMPEIEFDYDDYNGDPNALDRNIQYLYDKILEKYPDAFDFDEEFDDDYERSWGPMDEEDYFLKK